MTSLRSALVFCIAATLAGCAGTHGSSPLPNSNEIPLGVSTSSFAGTTSGTLTFQIVIPTYGVSRSYVSPATKGMLLAWNGASTGQRVFNLTHTNTNCVKTAKRVCTFKVSFAAGSYHGTFDLYDQAPAGGQIPFNANLLSTASNVPFTIISGQTKKIAPVLLGVPAKLSVGPMPLACAAIPPTPFAVNAFDADSHKIAGAYATAITLSDGDTSGATTIATSGYDNPPVDTLISSFDKATFAWNGNAIPGGSATISAQAGSASVYASAVFTPQTATPGSASFNYTGSEQTFTVPVCAPTIYIIADGAAGGAETDGAANFPGGLGGETGATIPTTPGEVLDVFVGGRGGYQGTGSGGYNGGGAGGYPEYQPNCGYFICVVGAGGGGGTDIRQGGASLANRVVVAGGGGGAGMCEAAGEGGGANGGSGGSGTSGGCQTNVDNSCAVGYPPLPPVGGGGGTQNAGGSGGGNNPGVFGAGAAGSGACYWSGNPPAAPGSFSGSGGGGGGWYGGGGGGPTPSPSCGTTDPTCSAGGGGGGGGSAYAEPNATNVYENGGLLNNSGNGFVFICWGYSNQMCGSASVKKLMARARQVEAHLKR